MAPKKFVDHSPVSGWHFFFGGILSLSAFAFIMLSHHDSTIVHRGSKGFDIASESHSHHRSSPSLKAVLGQSILMHNALKNDLGRMIVLAEKGIPSDWRMDHWKDIWLRQGRFQDEIIVPSLVIRMKKTLPEEVVPSAIRAGYANQGFDQIITKIESWQVMDDRYYGMKELFRAMSNYFEERERYILPRLLDNFSEQELWALDSIAYRREMDYFPPGAVEDLHTWWLRNLGLDEWVELFWYFFHGWKQPAMSEGDWKAFAKEFLSV